MGVAPLKQDLEYIGLGDLVVSEFNARASESTEEQATWEEFKADIKEKGLLQPLLVTKAKEGGYEVLEGRRRFLALQEIYSNREGKLVEGAPAVPCEIVEVKEAIEKLILSTLGNFHRLDMSPGEYASVIAKLKKMGMNQAQIAKAFQKSTGWVSMVKEGKAWTEHKKTSSSPVPQAREFKDTECPACGNVLGISLVDGDIVLEAKGHEDAKEDKKSHKKKGAHSK